MIPTHIPMPEFTHEDWREIANAVEYLREHHQENAASPLTGKLRKYHRERRDVLTTLASKVQRGFLAT